MTRKLLALSLLCASALAQLVDDFAPPRANGCLQSTAQALADQLLDWNQLGRYHPDNERLKAQPAEPGRVVFLGDSITDGWRLAQSFPGKPSTQKAMNGWSR